MEALAGITSGKADVQQGVPSGTFETVGDFTDLELSSTIAREQVRCKIVDDCPDLIILRIASKDSEQAARSLARIQSDAGRAYIVGSTHEPTGRLIDGMRKLRGKSYCIRPAEGAFWRERPSAYSSPLAERSPLADKPRFWTNDDELVELLDKHADRLFRKGSGPDGDALKKAARCKPQFVDTVLRSISQHLRRHVPDMKQYGNRNRATDVMCSKVENTAFNLREDRRQDLDNSRGEDDCA